MLLILWVLVGPLVGFIAYDAAGRRGADRLKWSLACGLLLGLPLPLLLMRPKPPGLPSGAHLHPHDLAGETDPLLGQAPAGPVTRRFTEANWRDHLHYDADLVAAAATLAPLGERGLDELKRACLTLQHRADPAFIARRILAIAKAESWPGAACKEPAAPVGEDAGLFNGHARTDIETIREQPVSSKTLGDLRLGPRLEDEPPVLELETALPLPVPDVGARPSPSPAPETLTDPLREPESDAEGLLELEAEVRRPPRIYTGLSGAGASADVAPPASAERSTSELTRSTPAEAASDEAEPIVDLEDTSPADGFGHTEPEPVPLAESLALPEVSDPDPARSEPAVEAAPPPVEDEPAGPAAAPASADASRDTTAAEPAEAEMAGPEVAAGKALERLTTVTLEDLTDAIYAQTYHGTHIFELRDGRFYIDGIAAAADVDTAMAAIEELEAMNGPRPGAANA